MSAVTGPSAETAGLSYSVRPGLRSFERTFRLQPESLFWQDARGTACIPYAQIAKVRLFSYGNFGLLVWNCTMKDRSSHKFGLTSAHYVRLGKFEDRMSTFAPFVRELLLRIAAANPKARFIAGSGRAMWFIWLLILIASVLVLAFMAIVLVQGEMTTFETMKSLPYFAVIIVLFPWVWRGVRRDWPRAFNPRNSSAVFPP